MTHSPDRLRDLERLLESVRFEPRASLGAEVVGRARRGERGLKHRAIVHRPVFTIAGVALLLMVGSFLFWLLALRPMHPFTVDRCCQDLDGGGDADDGLVVVAERGRTVKSLVIYEDRDGSHNYTPGDTRRFSRAGQPAVAGPLEWGARTVEFCCLDYDGGGASDDALIVVGLPPDRISMAAIYERIGVPGAPMELR